ncbi:MAG: hypothetical protein ACYDA6_04060 [Solirubrobacteraceae bacterium]
MAITTSPTRPLDGGFSEAKGGTSARGQSAPTSSTGGAGTSPRRRQAAGRSRTTAASSSRVATEGSAGTRRKPGRTAQTRARKRPGGGPAAPAGGTPRRAVRKGSAQASDYAERAVLIPVGAALIARERVARRVGDALSTFSSQSGIEAELRRFERRGATARTGLEREVRKARRRVERDVRQRRRALDRRSGRIRKDLSAQVEQAQRQLARTQTWFGEALRTRAEDGADLFGRAQERVLSLS